MAADRSEEATTYLADIVRREVVDPVADQFLQRLELAFRQTCVEAKLAFTGQRLGA